MLNVIRIIPQMKLGGVESGLLNEIKVLDSYSDIRYHIFVIEKSDVEIPVGRNVSVIYIGKNFFNFYYVSKKIKEYIQSNKLDNIIILSSLWKSHLVSFFLPKYYRVSFFHSSSYSHALDYLCSKMAFLYHDKSIYDSYSTRDIYSKSGFIVPYIFKKNREIRTDRQDLTFIFIGRINKVKGLERSLLIILELKNLGLNPVFDIYGPDEGEKNKLEKLVSEYGLCEHVKFKGSLEPNKVSECMANYTFYMQTSYREGMGASIILSQSIGLIPIVTPVGEVAKYCNNMNAIIIDNFKNKSIKEVSKKIIDILNDDKYFFNLRTNAIDVINKYQSFDNAISDVFNYLKLVVDKNE